MPRLLFVVPAAGRVELARICLTHLRHTCDQLNAHGIRASAVVIADDANLDIARELGFGTVERANEFVSKRFNDGFQLATDPEFNDQPADYVVPCGSDDFVDWRILLDLPARDTVRCFQRLSFVREDGRELTTRTFLAHGGCGIRIYPRELLAPLDYRPADEDRHRGCDMATLYNLVWASPSLRVEYGDIDARQIVDWKSYRNQLNPYESLRAFRVTAPPVDPFEALAGIYPAAHLNRMAAHYAALPAMDVVAA